MYAARSQRNILLKADVDGNKITSFVWKFNGTRINNREHGVEIYSSGWVPTGVTSWLEIESYDSATHMGMYQFLVTNPAGTTIVATWLVRDAGIYYAAIAS